MPAVFQLPASHVLPYRLVFCFASCRELFWHVICTSWKINSLQNVNDFTCFKFISNRVFPVKSSQLCKCFDYIKVKASFILLSYTAQTSFFWQYIENGPAKINRVWHEFSPCKGIAKKLKSNYRLLSFSKFIKRL